MLELLRDYHSRLTQFSANVKFYLMALALNSLGIGMFEVLYNLYLKELNYDEAFVGQTISLKALAAVLISLPAGFISDRMGRKFSMLLAGLFCGITYTLLAVMEQSSILLTLAFLNGLFNAFFMLTQSPFMMENTSPKERMHLFSINFALMTGTWMVGNLLGGGIPDLLDNFLPTQMAMKITLLICAGIIFATMIPVAKIKEMRRAEQRGFSQILVVIKERKELITIGKFLIPSMLVGFGAGLFVPYTNLYFSRQFTLSTSSIGFIMALGQVMTAIATLLGPLLVKQVGRVKAIFIFQITSLPFLLIMASTGQVYLAVVAVLMRMTLMNSANPITSNLMMEEVGDSVKGVANSLSQMAFQLGWAVMGPISGIIIATSGYSTIFYLAMLFYLGSALSYFMFFKHLDREKPVIIAQ